jgi:anti-anti-sigma regulatory factor/anti-sigma regulatory factor (Ser/Thr protein kinase)
MTRNQGLTCRTEQSFPVAVVQLQGMLSLSTVSLCRTALIKALTDQPTALVIDVTEVTCDDPVAVTVFRSVAQLAAEWPGTRIMLCGPTGDLATHLHRRGARYLEVFATRAGASAAAGRHIAPRRLRLVCDGDVGAPARARDVAVQTFRQWELPPVLVEGAEVIVSELVTNAVRHTERGSTLTLQLSDRYLHIAVRDGSSESPRTSPADDPLAASGRGMRIVAMLAASWGVLPTTDGKVVWATLPRTGSSETADQ